MSTGEDVANVEEFGGGLPPLKRDEGLFEQLVRGYQLLPQWDARYPNQGQTAVNAPDGYITLFADFFPREISGCW
ncbi:hypothetical protein Hanom_Chr12g01158731 [Helianthus anomalus]